MKRGVFVLTLILVTCVLAAGAWAGCPEGKSEVQLTTPSGNVKFICVPDAAMPGLETAADHSDGTIVPSSCPCWDEGDIAYYQDNRILYYCRHVDSTGITSCYDSSGEVVLQTQKAAWCANYVIPKEADISYERWQACLALLPYR